MMTAHLAYQSAPGEDRQLALDLDYKHVSDPQMEKALL